MPAVPHLRTSGIFLGAAGQGSLLLGLLGGAERPPLSLREVGELQRDPAEGGTASVRVGHVTELTQPTFNLHFSVDSPAIAPSRKSAWPPPPHQGSQGLATPSPPWDSAALLCTQDDAEGMGREHGFPAVPRNLPVTPSPESLLCRPGVRAGGGMLGVGPALTRPLLPRQAPGPSLGVQGQLGSASCPAVRGGNGGGWVTVIGVGCRGWWPLLWK